MNIYYLSGPFKSWLYKLWDSVFVAKYQISNLILGDVKGLGSNICAVTFQLCNFEQVTWTLHTLVS